MKSYLSLFTLVALTLASLFPVTQAKAQVLLSSGNYSQDFNSLSSSADSAWSDNSTLLGWYASQRVGGAVTGYRISAGTITSSSIYSYGAAADSDRALGSQAGGTPDEFAYGLRLLNDTPSVATNILVTFTGEQWRRLTGTGTNTLTFSYFVGSNITSADSAGTAYAWVPLYTLNFSTPNTAGGTSSLVGNASTNRQTVASLLLPDVQVGPGQELFLRWLDVNDNGTDHGLGLDDFSVTFTLESPTAPYITAQPQGRTNASGSTATFSVTVSGTPAFTYQWKKDGNDLTDVGNVQGATTARLRLTSVSALDDGIYTCGITNLVGGTNTADAALAVIDPGIISQPANSANLLGERQVFSVVAGGTGPFEYQWRKNGNDYGDATTNAFLIITNVGVGDVASYSVVVTNSLGNSVTSSVATLTLLATPAVEIAQWDFNGTPDGTNITGVITPTIGGGTAAIVGAATQAFSSGVAQDPLLATVDNSGWNTSTYPAATTSNKTTGVQFQFSTAGYKDILLTWHQRHSSTASRYTRLQYSADGIAFTDFHKITRTNTDFDREIVDLSSIPAANNNPNFAVRIVSEFESTATGLGSASYVGSSGNYNAGAGTMRFDWLHVFANESTAVASIPLNIHQVGADIVLTWTNATFNLQAAPTVTGTFTNIAGATSPYTNSLVGNPTFFRLVNP